MLTILPASPQYGYHANQIASTLRDEGCDVYVDEGYANSALNRIYAAGSKWILHVENRSTVRLRNRDTQEVTSGIKIRTFTANWRSYLDE